MTEDITIMEYNNFDSTRKKKSIKLEKNFVMKLMAFFVLLTLFSVY